MLSPDVTDRLKAADPDRYRAALLAQDDMREDLCVLYAFHMELAKIPELISEPMLGAIRYQWWRDCVDEIYTGKPVRRHEISTPLGVLLRRADVPRFWIDRLIDGRERDIDPRPFETLAEAKAYCAQTSGQLMQIAAKLTGSDIDAEYGTAWGLTGLARGYRFYHDKMLKNLELAQIIIAARDSYASGKAVMPKIAPALMPAAAYCGLIPPFLKRLSSSKFKPLQSAVVFGPLAKQSKLFVLAITGRMPK